MYNVFFYFRSVSNRFNIGKASLFWCFVRVINSLNDIAHEIIKWPNTAELNTIKNKFKSMAGISGVLGAIDGTYIPIKAPRENPDQYINRKCFHAMTLQAISVPDLKFVDCFTGYPSSVSDIRVFRNSPIFHEFRYNNHAYFGPNEFILGDKAYPLYRWCITPYIDRGHLNEMQTHFNICHARTRQVIERSFALLFGRFRRLQQQLDMNRIDLIPKTIIACCVLHNICLMDPDTLLQEYINEALMRSNIEDNNNNESVEGNLEYRDELARSLYEVYLNNL